MEGRYWGGGGGGGGRLYYFLERRGYLHVEYDLKPGLASGVMALYLYQGSGHGPTTPIM